MKRSLPWIVLALVAVFALILRRQMASQTLLEPGSVSGSAVAFVDPESAEHLRRVECALEGAPLGGSDAYWAHPQAVGSPHTPIYEALLVQTCEGSLAATDAVARETRLSWSGPVLGLLAVLAGFFAAGAWTRSRMFALLAALFCAAAPALLAPALANRLSVEALWWPLVLLYCGAFVRSLQAIDAVGTVLHALLAGLLGGLALAVSPLSLLPFAAATLAGIWRAFTQRTEQGVSLPARAGLLHALAAALVSRAPVAEGPWLGIGESVLGSWAALASLFALVSSTPFVVAVLVDRSKETRLGTKVAVWIGGLLMIVWMATQARGPLLDLFAVLPGALQHARALEGRSLFTALFAATPLVLALPFALWSLRGDWRELPVLFALLLGILALLAVGVHVLAGPLVALAMICVLPPAAERHAHSAWVRFGASGAVVLLLSLGGLFLMGRGAWPGGETLAWLRGLRWMREGTPSPGPWNAPQARADWGVLALSRHGEAIAFHARRPALLSRLEAFERPQRVALAHALLAGRDLAALEAFMRAQDARYLMIAEGDSAALEQLLDTEIAKGSVLARLERGEPLGMSALALKHEETHPGDPGRVVWRLYELLRPAAGPEEGVEEGPVLRAPPPIR